MSRIPVDPGSRYLSLSSPASSMMIIVLFSFMQVHRINNSGIVLTYKFKCYRIAAMRVVDGSLIAVCLHSLSVVKWNLTNGSVTKQLHDGPGSEQVTRVNLDSNCLASKG